MVGWLVAFWGWLFVLMFLFFNLVVFPLLLFKSRQDSQLKRRIYILGMWDRNKFQCVGVQLIWLLTPFVE